MNIFSIFEIYFLNQSNIMAKYNFSESEAKWQAYWEENQINAFNMDERDSNKTFSIDTPPPTVS